VVAPRVLSRARLVTLVAVKRERRDRDRTKRDGLWRIRAVIDERPIDARPRELERKLLSVRAKDVLGGEAMNVHAPSVAARLFQERTRGCDRARVLHRRERHERVDRDRRMQEADHRRAHVFVSRLGERGQETLDVSERFFVAARETAHALDGFVLANPAREERVEEARVCGQERLCFGRLAEAREACCCAFLHFRPSLDFPVIDLLLFLYVGACRPCTREERAKRRNGVRGQPETALREDVVDVLRALARRHHLGEGERQDDRARTLESDRAGRRRRVERLDARDGEPDILAALRGVRVMLVHCLCVADE